MSYREGQFHIKQTPHPPHPCDLHHSPVTLYPPTPWTPTTPWQSFVYSFGHYSMSRTTQSHRIPFERQSIACKHNPPNVVQGARRKKQRTSISSFQRRIR